MKPRIFYSLPVLAASLCLAGLPAYAQNAAPSFKPVKAWEAGPMGTVSKFSGECLLQTEFDNGFIMQFIGSSNWVQALNIDFRQDVFTPNDDYKSVVSVPNGTKQSIDANASAANLVSIPLKGRKALFQSLKSSAVMDLNVEGNEFRFFLTGFKDAANAFERCMAGGKDAIEGAPVDKIVVNESLEYERREAENKATINAAALETPKDIPYSQDHDIIEHSTVGARTSSSTPSQRPNAPAAGRLSERLAAEIASNPDLVDSDEEAVQADTFANKAPDNAEVIAKGSAPIPAPEPIVGADKTAQKVVDAAVPAPLLAAEPDAPAIAKSAEAFSTINKGGMRIIQSEPILSDSEAETITAEAEVKAEEKIVTPAPETQKEEMVAEAKPAPKPLAEPVAESMAAEPMAIKAETVPEKPAPVTRKIDTLKATVTRESYKSNADFTSIKPKTPSNSELAKMSVLERDIEMLRAENEALNQELSASLKEGEQERLAISSENWNLEQATKRYNEAERQIKRLGQQVQKERAQCSLEKRELEALLFDPEVTEQAQLARLSQLEQELAAAKAELSTLKGKN